MSKAPAVDISDVNAAAQSSSAAALLGSKPADERGAEKLLEGSTDAESNAQPQAASRRVLRMIYVSDDSAGTSSIPSAEMLRAANELQPCVTIQIVPTSGAHVTYQRFDGQCQTETCISQSAAASEQIRGAGRLPPTEPELLIKLKPNSCFPT